MRVRKELQRNPVSDDVLAKTAIVRPILTGILNEIKLAIANAFGEIDNIKLKMLPLLYRPGDGDAGICFEYAVHQAMNDNGNYPPPLATGSDL